jgi:hypothetical protein
MRGAIRTAWAVPLLLAGVAAIVFSSPPTVATAEEEEAVFPMREVSAFDKSDSEHGRLLTRGEYAECTAEPDKEVKAYPKLKSKCPLYGKVKFDRFWGDGTGIEFHFVLDESGEAPPSEKENELKKNEEQKQEKSLLQSLAEKLFGTAGKTKAGNEPPETKVVLSRYDRFYFDANRDLDLTNDPVLKPMKDPPWRALPRWTVKEKTAFEYLDVGFDYGPALGVRPFRILPWFTLSDDGKYTYMHFTATTAREGRIRIGKHQYDALLAQPYLIAGRFDRPFTALYLTPVDKRDKLEDAGFDSDMLYTMQRVDGQLYTISATPLGDKLTVRPYRGDFGLFKIGPGGRDIKDISLYGSLRSQTQAIGFGAARRPEGKEEKISECRVPVGDYLPSYLRLDYGPLWVRVSDNYHSDGKPRDWPQPVYGIKIRKDKPFVLDFSNKPEVLFASPGKGQTFKPDDEIQVKAVLVDPVLNIMIRGLNDTRQKQKETIELGVGRKETSERPLSLDPIVTITDAAGKIVSEGKMPFG